MSITVVTTVVCDLCANWTDATHGSTANRRAARFMARTHGWARRRTENVGYIDLCPECAGSGSSSDGES
jgi:hypothetical protein